MFSILTESGSVRLTGSRQPLRVAVAHDKATPGPDSTGLDPDSTAPTTIRDIVDGVIEEWADSVD
jgi:hypothetical protein